MTAAELEKLLAEAAEIASERREKAAESQLMADAAKASWGHSHASGWQMAAEYALRTAGVLDQTAALARRVIAAERMAEALRAAIEAGYASKPRIIGGVCGQTVEASLRRTMHDMSAHDLDTLSAALAAYEAAK